MSSKILLGIKRNEDDIHGLYGATTYEEIDRLFHDICNETSKNKRKNNVTSNIVVVPNPNLKKVPSKIFNNKGKFIASAPSSPRGGTKNESLGRLPNLSKNDITPMNNKNKVSWNNEVAQGNKNNLSEAVPIEEQNYQ